MFEPSINKKDPLVFDAKVIEVTDQEFSDYKVKSTSCIQEEDKLIISCRDYFQIIDH